MGEKSIITDFLVKYLEENNIEKGWISQKTGISIEKLKRDYEEALDAEEFLLLCALLQIEPEEIREIIKRINLE